MLIIGYREGQVTERFTRAIDQLGHKEVAVEVLTAYVRERAPRTGDPDVVPRARLDIDLQAALTLVGRRERQADGGLVLDLSFSDLREADLRGARLEGAVMTGARRYCTRRRSPTPPFTGRGSRTRI